MHTENIGPYVEDAPTVLVLGEMFDEETKEACTDLLSRDPLEDTDVVKITDAQSVRSPVKTWNEHAEGNPKQLIVINVAEQAADVAAADLPDFVEVENANPGDLTGLGIKLQRQLGDLQREEGPVHISVCFDALSTLLMYAETNVVYRFVRVVTQYFLAAGGTVHFHLDPSAYDQQTVQLFKSIMDTVVEVEPDGTYDVTTR